MTGGDDLDFARREVLLRKIGHEILLQSGDNVSRVLPVKKTGGDEYQISFEHAFTFHPDSLVHTTQRLLAKDRLASDYVVNVLNCGDSSVAYGFAISGNKKDDIIACLGRVQPKACYLLSIKFQSAEINTARDRYLLGGMALVAVLGYIFMRTAKPRSVVPEDAPATTDDHPTGIQNPTTSMFTLGSMLFDADTRKLMIDEKAIDLTKTEARVLRMFALAPNEAIERSRLQKEIWEDEGVIVGRSLDMFISKLRKKLEPDPNVKIVVLRGKGYRLQISSKAYSDS
ncbi:winged helix-turn-helix domain-containing protein [Cnuella takakiae]|nr:winged helix-turn-helix domain-containing protein [Cnuella takakiae]